MVELAPERAAGALDFLEVGDETVRRARMAAQPDLDPERMAMHAAILVAVRHAAEAVRRVEAELVADFHLGGHRPLARVFSHGIPISLCICRESRQRGR